MSLKFGTLAFSNEKEYYIALGAFCNRKAFSISYEPNKKTGSYADAYRIRKLATAINLIKPITDALRDGGRINCNKYVQNLLDNHNFVQTGKLIYGILENVALTVPLQYYSDFLSGYTNSSASSDKDKEITIYEVEHANSVASKLKQVSIPKAPTRRTLSTSAQKKTKHDYIRESIRQTKIGEFGERLVFNMEKQKLLEAKKAGKISSIDNLLKWVSLDDDSAGYDILSYDPDMQKPIYIEVKTTTGSKTAPFFMSKGELEFSKNNPSQYRLYRVYNINKDTAEYYELSGDLALITEIQIDSETYRVSLK